MADLLIFQLPIYFTAIPAIMKGWIDSTLSLRFGFNPITTSAYDTGRFKGKYAMLVTIIGAPKQMCSEGGAHGDFNKHLEALTHCVFKYMGLKVILPHIIYKVSNMLKERGTKELGKYKLQLLEL